MPAFDLTRLIRWFGLLGLASMPAYSATSAVQTKFVHLGMNVPGVLYQGNTKGDRSQIGVLVMHGADYLSFSACTELSERGYQVLCANPSGMSLDQDLLDIALGVRFLRSQPKIRRVVLFGHSGGATLMTAYQFIAENGVGACQAPEKIHKCPGNLAGLPTADAVVLPDANWGNAEMTLLSVDPAVVDDQDGMTLDSSLDMFDARNGFRPAASTYSSEFVHRFLISEGHRYREIIEKALARLSAIEARKGHYSDDETFTIAGASSFGPNNKLYSQDTHLLSHSRAAWPLLHADGSVTTEVIHSVRVPENVTSQTDSLGRGALRVTVRNFLASNAIRIDDDFGYDEQSIHGIHWTSTYSSPPGNVEGISVPLLAMGMTGHWEGLAAETIYEHAKSKDKSIAFVEGASHMYTTCKECEKSSGQYGDTERVTYDYIDRWLSEQGRLLKRP